MNSQWAAVEAEKVTYLHICVYTFKFASTIRFFTCHFTKNLTYLVLTTTCQLVCANVLFFITSSVKLKTVQNLLCVAYFYIHKAVYKLTNLKIKVSYLK